MRSTAQCRTALDVAKGLPRPPTRFSSGCLKSRASTTRERKPSFSSSCALYSSAPPASSSQVNTKGSSQHTKARDHYISAGLRTKNLLQTLGNDVLPRALARGSDSTTISTSVMEEEAWDSRIDGAIVKLDAEDSRPCIAYWAPRNPSAARDVVTALLEDPLSSDDARRTFLARRWEDLDSEGVKRTVLELNYGVETMSTSLTSITAPSTWLRNTNARILEISESHPQAAITQLLNADVKVLVIQTPQDLRLVSFRTSLLTLVDAGAEVAVLVNHPLLGESAQTNDLFKTVYQAELDELLAGSALTSDSNAELVHNRVKLHLVSSETAIDSQATFRRDQLQKAIQSSSASSSQFAEAVTRFQKTFADSGVPALSNALQLSINSLISSSNSTQAQAEPPHLPTQTALTTVSAALNRSRQALALTDRELVDARSRIDVLRVSGSTGAQRLRKEVFQNGGVVTATLREPRANVQAYFDALPYWKLPWRVDQLTTDVGNILRSSYGRDLERSLVFETGKMKAFQDSQDEAISRALLFPPTSPLHSPLLFNQLQQTDASITNTNSLSTTSLLAPISKRLHQLTLASGSPLAHLHLRAQILLVQAYALSIGGPLAAWGSWFGGYAVEEVALGVGTLSAVVGVRWMVGRWERAKRKWWVSWDRVDKGLERDLEAQFDSVMENVVLAKTKRASDGLEALVRRQDEILQGLSDEVETLARTAEEIASESK